MRGVCRDTLGQCTIKKDNTTNLTGSHDKFVSEREREGEGGREGGREETESMSRNVNRTSGHG